MINHPVIVLVLILVLVLVLEMLWQCWLLIRHRIRGGLKGFVPKGLNDGSQVRSAWYRCKKGTVPEGTV
jgi:hypothetical protein